MGRKTDVLLRGFRAAKCLTLLKLAQSRIKVLRNKRSISAKQMRGEIAQLLKTGQDAQVYITKADALIKQENMVAVYDLIDQYCHAIISRFPTIEMQSNCPIDMKGPIATLIFAAPRCVELSELASIKEAFTAKYGKEFAAAAMELRPDCSVNKQVIELLSTRPATGDMKLKIMKEISVEYKVNWMPGEALAEPSSNTTAGSSHQPAKDEAGPSNSSGGTKTTLQGGSKHEGINKSGMAAAEPSKPAVLASDASKSSGTKHGISSEEDVGKLNASILQSLNKGATSTGIPSAKFGLAATGSLKTGDGAVFAANAFKTNDTKEGSMGRASFNAVESLKGVMNTGTSSATSGSFKESNRKPGGKAEAYVQHVVDAQDGMSDSDNDSFVSVEEGRLEDDAEVSPMGESARRESFGKNSLQAFVKANAHGPSLTKDPSRETRESSSSTVSWPADSSKQSSFTMESSQQDMVKQGSFTMENSQQDMFLNASRKNSFNTEALPEEKSFRAESRKSSLREEKSSGLTMASSHEDVFLRANSKNSSNTDTLLEEKALRAESRKGSLREKKLAEEQSFKQGRENALMKMQLEDEQSFEASVEEGVQRKDVLEDTSFVALAESPVVENLFEMKKVESFSAEVVSSGAGEDVSGKGASLNINESVSKQIDEGTKQIDDVPSIEKGVQELNGTSSLGALATPEYSQDFDFAAAVQAIAAEAARAAAAAVVHGAPAEAAAEAARLAVLNFSKQIGGSGSVPVDLTDLTKFGPHFEGNPKGSQVTKKLNSEGKSEEVREEVSKVEIAVSDGKDIKSDHAKIDEMGCVGDANAEKSMHLVADDGDNCDTMGHTHAWTKYESLQQPDLASENDDINPFAMEIDKATDSLFSKTAEDDNSSWVPKTEPELVSKAGGFGQEEDHLDIFFKRKTPRFDEDRYSFVDVKSSFLEEKVPYFGYDKKESILKDKFVATAAVFDSLPAESQSTPLFVESSDGSFKESIAQDKLVATPVFDSVPESQSTPLFDDKSSGSFKIPVFDDEGLDAYDTSFSFDDGLDKSGLPDKKGPPSPPNITASPRFDLELEPSVDKVVDEEEQSTIEKRESGQLKWQSKKPTSGETLASDASLGVTSKPMSRRSRKPPQRIDEHEYGSESPAQGKLYTDGGLTSKRPQVYSSSPMQEQQKEQGRRDKYDVADKGNVRTRPAESFAYGGDAVSKRPSGSPKRVSVEDQWDFTSTSVEDRFPSSRMTKSPIRSSQRQKATSEERDEDFYFREEIGSSSAGSGMSRRSTKSPTKVAKQQPLPQVYEDDDDAAEGYTFSNMPSRIPKFSQQDMVDDDSIEEPVPRYGYKPYRQSDDLGKGTSASSAMYRQKPHRQQEDYAHTQYAQVNGVGKSNPTSRLSARRKQQDVDEDEEEEPHLAPRSKPSAHVDDLGRASSSPMSGHRQRRQHPQEEKEVSMEQHDWRQGERRKEQEHMPRPSYRRKQDSRLEKETSDSSIEDYDQQQEEQWHPSMLSEQEKQRRRLPPRGQEKQRRPSPPLQKHGQEEEEEFDSMPLPDWRQEESRKEKERMARPLYGRKQDTIEDYEQQQEEQQRPSMLSEQEGGQEKQRRRLPPYGVEKQRRPLPPYQQYEQEEEEEEFHSMPLPAWRQEERHKETERMPRPLHGRKQDSRLEKENSNLSIKEYEQQQKEQRRSSTLSKQEQDTQRRPSPPYARPPDSRLERENSETWQQEKIRQEQQLPSQSLVEEVAEKWQQGRKKEHLPSPVYTRQQEVQEEKKSSESSMGHKLQKEEQLHQSTVLPEGKQEQDGQGNENRPWPLYSRKEEPKLEKEKSLAKDEGVEQEKPEIKAQPPARRPPSIVTAQSTSPPLESSISDPIILATIPPPVKKPVARPAPAATTLESAVSAPSPSSVPEVKVPKVPQKPPNVEELMANFEALRRARKGE